MLNSSNPAASSESPDHPGDPTHYPGRELFEFDRTIYNFESDEFRMYGYKIKECPRMGSHAWNECPFAHRGEKARRRDPRKYNYDAVLCLHYRDGVCRRGDTCHLAHGVFEYWLHPDKYRTRFCNSGEFCRRKVCFFAHTPDELRGQDEPDDNFGYVYRVRSGDDAANWTAWCGVGRGGGVGSVRATARTVLDGTFDFSSTGTVLDGNSDLLASLSRLTIARGGDEWRRSGFGSNATTSNGSVSLWSKNDNPSD